MPSPKPRRSPDFSDSLAALPHPPAPGTLDQGNGTLEVFEEPPPDVVYPAALATFDNMGRVVDNLFARSQKIIA